MSDNNFVDEGDLLTVSISGFPVAKARVDRVEKKKVKVRVLDDYGNPVATYYIPLNVKEYDTVDGYGHGSQPLTGVQGDVFSLEDELRVPTDYINDLYNERKRDVE